MTTKQAGRSRRRRSIPVGLVCAVVAVVLALNLVFETVSGPEPVFQAAISVGLFTLVFPVPGFTSWPVSVMRCGAVLGLAVVAADLTLAAVSLGDELCAGAVTGLAFGAAWREFTAIRDRSTA